MKCPCGSVMNYSDASLTYKCNKCGFRFLDNNDSNIETEYKLFLESKIECPCGKKMGYDRNNFIYCCQCGFIYDEKSDLNKKEQYEECMKDKCPCGKLMIYNEQYMCLVCVECGFKFDPKISSNIEKEYGKYMKSKLNKLANNDIDCPCGQIMQYKNAKFTCHCGFDYYKEEKLKIKEQYKIFIDNIQQCPCGLNIATIDRDYYQCSCGFSFDKEDDIKRKYKIWIKDKISCPCGKIMKYCSEEDICSCGFVWDGLESKYDAYKEFLGKEPEDIGQKYDSLKLMLELVPSEAIYALAMVLTYGSKKYSTENWRKGIEYKRVYGALQRHLTAWFNGEQNDSESDLPHLYHAIFGLSILITYESHEIEYKKFDNRHKYYTKVSPETLNETLKNCLKKVEELHE